MTKFLNWFDKTHSLEETQQRAASDWKQKITAFKAYTALPKRRCLEIGYGGGRLIVEASKDFDEAVGVDLHAAVDKTRQYIHLHGRSNIRLLHRDEIAALADGSVDFVFSFIVFQHFDTFQEAEFYLYHIKRLLSPQGCAHIFFAKNKEPGITVIGPEEFKKRHCSLLIEPSFFRSSIATSFTILESQDVMKKHVDRPASPENESEQSRVVFTLAPSRDGLPHTDAQSPQSSGPM